MFNLESTVSIFDSVYLFAGVSVGGQELQAGASAQQQENRKEMSTYHRIYNVLQIKRQTFNMS